MEGRSFNAAPRTTERRAAAPQAYRAPAETPPPVEEHEPRHRAPSARRGGEDKKSWKRFLLPLIIVLVVIVLAVGGWFGWSKLQAQPTGIDSSAYQAVFFTNGQVYFGRLTPFSSDSMKLTDIFYLQTTASDTSSDAKDNPQSTAGSKTGSDVQLIKLGSEVHGPQDAMIIEKSQILFYENLKSDGKVAQSIAQYNSANK